MVENDSVNVFNIRRFMMLMMLMMNVIMTMIMMMMIKAGRELQMCKFPAW